MSKKKVNIIQYWLVNKFLEMKVERKKLLKKLEGVEK